MQDTVELQELSFRPFFSQTLLRRYCAQILVKQQESQWIAAAHTIDSRQQIHPTENAGKTWGATLLKPQTSGTI